MLAFSGHIIEEVSESCKWGVLDKDKKKIQDHLAAIRILKERGVKGSGIINAYHARMVAPLMRRALPLHMMAPGVSLDRTVVTEGALSPTEVAQRIKEAMEPPQHDAVAILDFVYPVPGHPPMRPEPGYIVFVSFSFLMPLF